MALKRPTGEALATELGQATGYAFRDHALMQRALTHSSARGAAEDNERLEFLGDRVLGLIVAELLFLRFPAADQGELALRLNALVSGETCGAIALDVGLDRMIRADPVARRTVGRKAGNALADAVEALIAALYLDGGLPAARAFVERYWLDRIDVVVQTLRSAKTELQEWLARSGVRPIYSILDRTGPDHEPVFTVLVAAEGFEPMSGVGRSRQAAEQAAALAFLAREGVRESVQ